MNKIWHYTTHSAALEIWNSKKLRLTSLDFVNDSSEQIFFLSELHKFLDSFESEESKTLNFNLKTLHHKSLGMGGVHYISCFSLEGDDVSQWERYGSNASGVALCFNRKKLAEKDLRIDIVEYFDSETLQSHFQDYYNTHKFDFQMWINLIHKKSMFVKQKHFSSENEVRITITKHAFKNEHEHFYARENTIAACIFCDISDHVITEIKMGPRSRKNSKLGWRQLTDPDFHKNNSFIWRSLEEMDDENSYIFKTPITESSCTLV